MLTENKQTEYINFSIIKIRNGEGIINKPHIGFIDIFDKENNHYELESIDNKIRLPHIKNQEVRVFYKTKELAIEITFLNDHERYLADKRLAKYLSQYGLMARVKSENN